MYNNKSRRGKYCYDMKLRNFFNGSRFDKRDYNVLNTRESRDEINGLSQYCFYSVDGTKGNCFS